MSNTLALSVQRMPAVVGNLPGYIAAVNAIPMLSEAEELSLAQELRERDSMEAAQRLILSHLRFVVRIARDYRNYGLPMEDLVQEGNVGLMMAVRRFNPDVGVRLAAYAVHWIRARIYEYVLHNWRIVRVVTTKAQRKLFFNLHRMKKHLGWFNREQVEEVAAELGVTPADVTEMEMRLAAQDELFDPWSHADEDDAGRGRSQAYLADMRHEPSLVVEASQQEAVVGESLHAALETLDERSRAIIERRWFAEPKATLKELAEEYGVSLERIRQIENAAMQKMRRKLEFMA